MDRDKTRCFCGGRTTYEEDRDNETGQLQNWWYQCEDCGECFRLREPKAEELELLVESENIKARFALPSGVCVCGHSEDSHFNDPEESYKSPCNDGDGDGSLCRCEDYEDSENGEIEDQEFETEPEEFEPPVEPADECPQCKHKLFRFYENKNILFCDECSTHWEITGEDINQIPSDSPKIK